MKKLMVLSIFFTGFHAIGQFTNNQTHYLALIGGSTKDDNSDLYEDQSQSIYDAVKARNGNIIFAFANGPESLPDEGYYFDYQASHQKSYSTKFSSPFDEKKNLIKYKPFKKDFNDDGKIDVQFPGTISGMKQAIQKRVSSLKPGDTLQISIGDHGDINYDFNKKKKYETFNSNTTLEGFVPHTAEELFKQEQREKSKITYDEIYSLIDEELKKKSLSGKIKIRMDSQSCFGGGMVALTEKGVCTTAATVGNDYSSGIPDPLKLPKPPVPLSDLRENEKGGYLHYYYQYLKNHPGGSPLDAYWYSTFRDITNTPVSSLEFVIHKYLESRSRQNEFSDFFDNKNFLKKSIDENRQFDSSSTFCREDQEIKNLQNKIETLKASIEPLAWSPQRQQTYVKYNNFFELQKKEPYYLNWITEENRLLVELEKEKAKILKKFGFQKDFFDLPKSEQNKIEHDFFASFISQHPEISKDPNFKNFPLDQHFLLTPEYKAFTSEVAFLGLIQLQVNKLKTHREHIERRSLLYLDFIKNSNETELAQFNSMEDCLNAPF